MQLVSPDPQASPSFDYHFSSSSFWNSFVLHFFPHSFSFLCVHSPKSILTMCSDLKVPRIFFFLSFFSKAENVWKCCQTTLSLVGYIRTEGDWRRFSSITGHLYPADMLTAAVLVFIWEPFSRAPLKPSHPNRLIIHTRLYNMRFGLSLCVYYLWFFWERSHTTEWVVKPMEGFLCFCIDYSCIDCLALIEMEPRLWWPYFQLQ